MNDLARLVRDMDAADPLYQPTQFWRVATARLLEEIAAQGLQRFRSMAGPLSYFVPTYGFPGYNADPARFEPVRSALDRLALPDARCARQLVRLFTGEAHAEADYRVLLAGDTATPPYLDRFSESRVGEPIEQFEFDGRRFGRSSLNYLLGLAFLKRHCDLNGVRRVLEIGGGFGSLGEILLADSRNDYFYVDVDIPPTIYVASWYLRALHGEAVADCTAAGAGDPIRIQALTGRHRAAMLASWQLPQLEGPIDLFVNFISFQEMEPAVVRNYFSQVDRLRPRYVLLRNIREGKAKAASATALGVREPILGPMYDDFLAHYALKATNTVPFGHRTVDGFHSELRVYERR